MYKVETNWEHCVNYYVPPVGLHVWKRSDGDAYSEVIKEVRMCCGLPEVFLGDYFSNPSGKEFMKANKIYLNECLGQKYDNLKKKFSKEEINKYFVKHWVSCTRISLPNSNERFIQRTTYDQMQQKINKLME